MPLASRGSNPMAVIYKLKTPTLGILRAEDGHRIPITIPLNAIITLGDRHAPTAESELDDWGQLVEVQWGDKTVRMFEQDIRQRCDRVGAA